MRVLGKRGIRPAKTVPGWPNSQGGEVARCKALLARAFGLEAIDCDGYGLL
jgi:hypothetical protein